MTHLTVDTQEIVFQNCSDMQIVKVEATQEPTAQTPDWISVSIVKDGNLKWKFFFTSQKNETLEEREDKIVLACNGESAVIPVTQEAGVKQAEKPVEMESAEEILLAVQNIYTMDYLEEAEDSIRIVFHEPSAITIKNEYPNGIADLTVAKSSLRRYEVSEDKVVIGFKSGKSATLKFYVVPQDTPESMLVALGNEHDYKIYSIQETDDDLTVIFHDPKPVTLVNDYPGGVSQITISRSDLRTFTDTIDEVTFKFKSGSQVTFEAADIPLSVTFDRDIIEWDCIDPQTCTFNTVTVDFTVSGSRPEKMEVTAVDTWACYSADLNGNLSSINYRANTSVKNVSAGNFQLSVWADSNGSCSGDDIKVTVRRENTTIEAYIPYKKNKTEIGLTEQELKSALVALYNACGGPHWEYQDNWCSDKPVKEWYGVDYYSTCKDNITFNPDGSLSYGEYIIGPDCFKIDFNGQEGMSGTIPDEFWDVCEYATFLRFDGDLTSSEMPARAWGEHLFYVDFANTGIKADLSQMHHAKDLRYVDFIGCDAILTSSTFSGSYPKLTSLTTQSATPRPLPQNIGNLSYAAPQLEVLQVGNVSGDFQESLFDITQLIVLSIQGETYGDISPKIQNMKRLTSFQFPKYLTSGKVPNEMGNCKYLKNLVFGRYDYITEYFDAIRYIPFSWNTNPSFGMGQLYSYQEDTGTKVWIDKPDWVKYRYDHWYFSTWEAEWPYSDDLQHPADEIFWVNGQWQHRPDMKYEVDNNLTIFCY